MGQGLTFFHARFLSSAKLLRIKRYLKRFQGHGLKCQMNPYIRKALLVQLKAPQGQLKSYVGKALDWGFLKLLRGRDGQPNMGHLQLQLYKYDNTVPGVAPSNIGGSGGSTTPRASTAMERGLSRGRSAEPLGSPRGGGPPAVWHAWRAAVKLPAAKRPLYPAGTDGRWYSPH
jgi:hypothetical protein